MNNKFVNNFNDYLKTNTKTSYNDKYLKHTDIKKNYDYINYHNNYTELLEKNYGNKLLIDKNLNNCLYNKNKILDINNYKKKIYIKKNITNTTYSNSPFIYDNYNYFI